MSSPVARTMAALRSQGYDPWQVQRSIPTKPYPTSIDLYGIVDLECLADDHTLYVQVCRDSDLSDHFAKCLAQPQLARLLNLPTRPFQIWSWAKKANRWRVRVYRAGLTAGGVVFVEATANSQETPMQAVQAGHAGAEIGVEEAT